MSQQQPSLCKSPEPWLVVCSKPNQETRAEINLRRQSDCISNVYYPRAWVKGRVRSLFPNYLFIQVINNRISTVASTYGVRQLLRLGGNIASISEDQIEEIRAKESNGIIELSSYKAGQKLNWGNIPVIFEEMLDHERCSVLFSMLGKSHHKILPIRQLMPAED